jgi:16S rRNA U516 pseudouridylate synthase RsuA-like enzyme
MRIGAVQLDGLQEGKYRVLTAEEMSSFAKKD